MNLPMDMRDTLVDSPSEELFDDESHVRTRRGLTQRLHEIVADRYELVDLLGHGASGAVYAARDLMDSQRSKVAIKLLHRHLRSSKGHTARFQREIRALSEIAHSAVVRVLDSGTDVDGTHYLVMELLEGELLGERIERGMEVREVMEVGRQLLGALTAAHDRGIVHRDIKPENLFLARSPNGSIRLKILDFGIAKLVRPDTVLSFQTLDGLILGTPEYMSPEVCRGEKLSEAADLWAAAAVLFHLLAGYPPFEDEQVGRLLLKIVKGPAPRLAELHPEVPNHLATAIDRALERDPSARWQSAREFATGLATSAPIDDLDWD